MWVYRSRVSCCSFVVLRICQNTFIRLLPTKFFLRLVQYSEDYVEYVVRCLSRLYSFRRIYMRVYPKIVFLQILPYSALYPEYCTDRDKNFVRSTRMNVFWQINTTTKIQDDTHNLTSTPTLHVLVHTNTTTHTFRSYAIYCGTISHPCIISRTDGHMSAHSKYYPNHCILCIHPLCRQPKHPSK